MPEKLSTGAKVGLGCGGGGCLTVVVIVIAAIISVVVGGGPAETADEAAGQTASASATAEPVPTTETPVPTDTVAPGTALAMLADLDTKGRAPKTGYDADLFHWRSDVDHNGCDTRNDVLRRDLSDITLKRGSNGCVVVGGMLDDPYLGESYEFDRDPNNIDIDHVVARSNAWQTGAQDFDEAELEEFGNDPLNLLAVSSTLNRQKGDGDAATWLPPQKSFRCEYVSRQIAVKHKYGLWVVKAERDAMTRVLESCEDEPAFAEDVSWPAAGDGDNVTVEPEPTKTKRPVETSAPDPEPKRRESEPEPKRESSGGSVYYKNCSAARAAGAAPVRVGDPGYGRHLDRDGDGVGCE